MSERGVGSDSGNNKKFGSIVIGSPIGVEGCDAYGSAVKAGGVGERMFARADEFSEWVEGVDDGALSILSRCLREVCRETGVDESGGGGKGPVGGGRGPAGIGIDFVDEYRSDVRFWLLLLVLLR